MLILPRALARKLIELAEGDFNREVCGVLAGSRNEDKARVAKIFPCSNVHPSPESNYEIAPAELLKVIQGLEGEGLEILGFYHSHTMALPRPSAVDSATATWPGHSYVIVSPRSERRITSWTWREEGFVEEEVMIS